MANKTQIRNEMRCMNYKVYENVVKYLIGPKWPGGKYEIDGKRKTTNDFVIRIDGGYMTARISIYFGYGIRISAVTDNMNSNEKVWYTYWGDRDTYALPDDVDEYIRITSEFLKELCKHVTYIQYCCEHYAKPLTLGVDDDVLKILCEHDVHSFNDLVVYEYTYNDEKEFIETMIRMFKSKKFKRAIGSNK